VTPASYEFEKNQNQGADNQYERRYPQSRDERSIIYAAYQHYGLRHSE
jgi:hypothetical protein